MAYLFVVRFDFNKALVEFLDLIPLFVNGALEAINQFYLEVWLCRQGISCYEICNNSQLGCKK